MNPLFAVRDCLQRAGMASAAEIAHQLDLPVTVVEGALAHWVRRALAEEMSTADNTCTPSACKHCAMSCTAAGKIYRYRGEVRQTEDKRFDILPMP